MIRLLSPRIVELFELLHALRGSQSSQSSAEEEPGSSAVALVAAAGFWESAKEMALDGDERVQCCLNMLEFWVQQPDGICDVLVYETLILDVLMRRDHDEVHYMDTRSLQPVLDKALKCGSTKIVDTLIKLGVRTHWSDYSEAMYKTHGLQAHCGSVVDRSYV